MRIVVKIGTSSITTDEGALDAAAIAKLCREVAELRTAGHQALVVTSGAISAGLPALGFDERPRDSVTLQAASAVGQTLLMDTYNRSLAEWGFVGAQILVAPTDFFERHRYLHARGTLQRLLEMGAVPVVNENDAVTDDAIRFGDNDRIAALVAHLVTADLLLLLTDTPGVLTADPRRSADASLIEEIVEFDHRIDALAGGAGSQRGSGGMASKLSAARMASWSGVRTVIAQADRDGVVSDAVNGVSGVGTTIRPRTNRLSAKRLWIAFAVPAAGSIRVDGGAKRALLQDGRSLLPIGVIEASADFVAGEAVELLSEDGSVFAKGIAKVNASQLGRMAGQRTDQLFDTDPHEVVHRDDLVLMP